MDFARKQLEKYGWQEGDGLGKTKSGIAKPLKAKLKFDNAGLGHNLADELVDPWWARVYDDAASNIAVSEDGNKVKLEYKEEENDLTIKKRKKKKRKMVETNYDNFIKTSCLSGSGEIQLLEKDEDEQDMPKKLRGAICDLDDDELFKACGGRTGHKGARHGISMSAKLDRLEKQENLLLLKYKGDSNHVVKKPKKRKKT